MDTDKTFFLATTAIKSKLTYESIIRPKMSNFTYFLCTVFWYCQFYSEEHSYKDLESSDIDNIFPK